MLSNSLMRQGALLGVLFFYSSQVIAQNWQDLQWQKILLYHKTLTGYESEADHPSYFSHPDGQTNPKKELEAFIKSIEEDHPDPKKNAQCRFPARVRWLRKFREVPETKVNCEEYKVFRDRIAAKSISVVFSSYYLNNPGSSFGHTFIRFGKNTNEVMDQDSTTTELLDTGINYGALTEGAHPVIFAIGGLAGWFSGNYNAIPYYYKVREYNDYETRDLWSYQLDMSQEEIDFMVDHIWELGTTRFDYFFLTENCSYHVLSILEAARPTLRLHEFMPRLYTIPSETLKALMHEGLVRKVTFRPSASTQFYHQLNLLNKEEEKAAKELFFDKKSPPEFEPERKSLVYDTVLSLVDYKYAADVLKGEEKAQALKRPLLIARSKIPVRSKELDFSYKFPEAPHLGHGQKRVALSYASREGKNLVDLEWRFAFHDILDNVVGYPPKTSLEIMKAHIRTDGQDYQLRDFSLLDVRTLGKWDIYNKAASWKLKLGQTQTRFESEDLTTFGFSGGYGYSYELGPFTPYLLAHVEAGYIFERLHKFKPNYGGDVGILTDISSDWKLNSVFEGRAHPYNESNLKNEIRYSNRHFGIGAYHQVFTIDGDQEVALRIFKYL